MIQAEHLSFSYLPDGFYALKDINVEIPAGQWVAIIGANGSGKSTLARHFNGLLLPDEGRVLVDGLNTAVPEELFKVRQKVAFVFQNPDNQMVATSVEDDIAFGPENLGLPVEEIGRRLEESLVFTGLTEKRHQAPHLLSGGEKQRVAIAGALAMRSAYMVLDEPTSMLDPQLRLSVIATLRQLHKELGLTIIYITNIMEEALLAERVLVLEAGRLLKDSSPVNVFSDAAWLAERQLAKPPLCYISTVLAEEGYPELASCLTEE
ncbi:MAG: energy-coupling factor transporter ATPase, partial [Firmicutes bacterium]|nr:energy-coupling factor transporter ATPase [Bacillota bacterium]